MFWSLLVNISLYVLGSLLYEPHKSERTLTNEFLSSMLPSLQRYRARPTGLDAYIELASKMAEAEVLLTKYLNADKAYLAVNSIADDLQILSKSQITIIELIEFHRMLEHVLSGAIGAASAHRAIETSIRYSDREAADLKALYSHLVSELHGQHLGDAPPGPVAGSGHKAKGEDHFGMINELQRNIETLEQTIEAQQAEISQLETKLDSRYEAMFRYRLNAQKLKQENELLRRELGAIRAPETGQENPP
ncbi:hypothetical protein [Marinobacterium aestuariivivens]|uniref:Uncharacterized protein n=1 Tax=Marinobacterium aestuariivivens TaxID=1698799 RepID=A0ABW1ZUG8_9GAMM